MSKIVLPKELILRIDVIQARDLAIKDLTGSSDPYAALKFGEELYQTPIVQKSLNPVWNASLEIPITKDRLKTVGGIHLDLWDKDRIGKDFLGEVDWKWDLIFRQHNLASPDDPPKSAVGYDDPDNKPQWYVLEQRHHKKKKIPIPRSPKSLLITGAIQIKFGLVDSPKTGPQIQPRPPAEWIALWEEFHGKSRAPTFETLEIELEDDGNEKKEASHSHSHGVDEGDTDDEDDEDDDDEDPTKPSKEEGLKQDENVKFRGPDTLGVAFMEVTSASNLPRLPNATRTTFDMDPFVIVTFCRSTFRTRAIRHTLDPIWNEKKVLHVRRSELRYAIKFAVYDQDKITENDFIGTVEIPVQDLVAEGVEDEAKLKRDSRSGKVGDDSINAEMKTRTVELVLSPGAKNANKTPSAIPTLTFRTKFLPYANLRRRFWLALCRAYDADANGRMGRMEVRTMMDSVGSTLKKVTVDGFWKKYGRDPEVESGDELSFEELADCLEEWLGENEKMRLERREARRNMRTEGGDKGKQRPHSIGSLQRTTTVNYDEEDSLDSDDSLDRFTTTADDDLIYAQSLAIQSLETNDPSTPTTTSSTTSEPERLLNITTCPVCHRGNMPRNATDVLTHVALCSSSDWSAVDRFVMGGFVTEAYAQRKWFTKLVSKVGYGKYMPGENNANILVIERQTGRIIEEKMPVYLRLGMRLLYQGVKTSVESRSAQRILTSLTVKQGLKYNNPRTVAEIPHFIAFHGLDKTEILEPIDSFRNFNEFFYRKLKPGARPCDEPANPKVCVSPADCRMMAFDTVSEATNVWIKGLGFSIPRLLEDEKLAENYVGGSLAIFRLAPQDYHRFHFPVDGVIGEPRHIDGQYFTVNPMAIRTTLDVYGENTRTILTVNSPQFGLVTLACIGAMMVGSIIITAPPPGSHVKRTDEMGYFAFGGSTIVVLWQKGMIEFDADLKENAGEKIETLVKVGMRVGLRNGE